MAKLVNVRLDLNIPGIGGISGTWEPDESEVKAAWELYVEMVTRTPLGGLSSQEGSSREALDSIYSLFDTTRGILRDSGPGVARAKSGNKLSFGYLAISMLNRVLRPLLTEWHPKLGNWEHDHPNLHESEWQGRSDFQSALDEVRVQLRQYADLFAEVAEVPELMEGGDATTATA